MKADYVTHLDTPLGGEVSQVPVEISVPDGLRKGEFLSVIDWRLNRNFNRTCSHSACENVGADVPVASTVPVPPVILQAFAV